MAPRPKTAFDRYFDEQMKYPAFAAEYRAARAEIDAIDKRIRALDAARLIKGLSRAELARKIGAQPEMIRRLLTAPKGNPTMDTVVKVATALGLHLDRARVESDAIARTTVCVTPVSTNVDARCAHSRSRSPGP